MGPPVPRRSAAEVVTPGIQSAGKIADVAQLGLRIDGSGRLNRAISRTFDRATGRQDLQSGEFRRYLLSSGWILEIPTRAPGPPKCPAPIAPETTTNAVLLILTGHWHHPCL